jgi:phage terminase large subunit-like protein
VESYAGYSGESVTLEQLYNTGVKKGKRHPLFPDIPVYVNVPAKMFCYWDEGQAARRMPWQTEEYYMEEAQLLTDAEFSRIHMNQWAESQAKAIPIAWWDRLEDVVFDGRPLPSPNRYDPMILGVDASISHDCCAVVGVTRHPERHDETAVRFVRVWEPAKGHAIDYGETLEPAIRQACRDWNIIMVAYDKYQLHKLMTDLRKEGLSRFFDFSQMTRRALADKQLFDKIVRREITHNGSRVLRSHVDNAAVKESTGKFRFEKMDIKTMRDGASARPIDALIALSMADYECTRLNL